MSIDISKIESLTQATIRVHLSGAPDLKADYVDRYIQPYYAVIIYTYRQYQDGGWIAHEWAATSVRVVGHRILKPGPDGAQRLGKDTHDRSWSHSDVQRYERKYLPEWIDHLITELRPSGDLSLVGAL